MLCLENAVRSGTTTVLDHHASPNHIGGLCSVFHFTDMESVSHLTFISPIFDWVRCNSFSFLWPYPIYTGKVSSRINCWSNELIAWLFAEGSLDQIEKAAEASGVRHCLCYEVTDRNGVEGADAGIKESVRFLKWGACSMLNTVYSLTCSLYTGFTWLL